jgi:hypothetical protein
MTRSYFRILLCSLLSCVTANLGEASERSLEAARLSLQAVLEQAVIEYEAPGAVALIGPGPGILILLAGLGILATEFAWAGRVMMHTKRIAAKAAERTGMKPWVKYFLISGGAVVSIITIFIYYSR